MYSQCTNQSRVYHRNTWANCKYPRLFLGSAVHWPDIKTIWSMHSQFSCLWAQENVLMRMSEFFILCCHESLVISHTFSVKLFILMDFIEIQERNVYFNGQVSFRKNITKNNYFGVSTDFHIPWFQPINAPCYLLVPCIHTIFGNTYCRRLVSVGSPILHHPQPTLPY